ncbi:MAG: hypothetical protein KDD25_08640, partial [Bdellovibrionales bacterium]|nr:hypothetical protein [Bdellovibrionales bacterium]
EDFIVHFDRDLAKLDSSISQLIQQSQSKIFGSFSLKRGSQVVRRVQMLRRGFDSARANINPEMPLVLQVTPLTLDSSLNLDYTLLAGIAVIKLPIAAEYIYSGEIPDRAAIVCLGQTLDVKIDAMTHELLGVMNPSLDCHVVKPVEERKRIRR